MKNATKLQQKVSKTHCTRKRGEGQTGWDGIRLLLRWQLSVVPGGSWRFLCILANP